MRKIISMLVIFALIFNNFVFFDVKAVETNGVASPWTIEKANHLARKALFGIDGNKVKDLFYAGSAEDAVNLLFPSVTGPDRTSFEAGLNELTSDENFNFSNHGHMRNFYLYKKMKDPYEAKAKLFTIFEDIFSVFRHGSKDITFVDIEQTHDLLYSHTLGNYKEMIKRNLYNNGNPGDYSLGRFLDLFNQSNPSRPNENYGRELLQLFLMLEYIPGDSEDRGDSRNYSEEDVNAVSKILFGFEADENTHEVTFNASANTNTSLEFLSGDLASGDSFPFYNESTGEFDIQLAKNSISGNNGLPDNTMDYIFSKREKAISMFLADKFYRFYVAENPTREELESISNKIIENNFEIYPTIKWLLASDMMYSEKSMNEIIYKNPLELSIGTANIFGLEPNKVDTSSLYNLGWNPYYPPNIFGRDGFDNNSAFFTSYTQTQWVTESSKFVRNLEISDLLPNNISVTNFSGNAGALSSYPFLDGTESIKLITQTGSNFDGEMNFGNFSLTASGETLDFSSASIDFENLEIIISENEKIVLTDSDLVFVDGKIVINSGKYIGENVSKNVSGEINISGVYYLNIPFTPEYLVGYLEDKIYLQRRLNDDVKNKLVDFLTTDKDGNNIEFNYLDNNYKNNYVKGLIHLMLVQPEFVLQSGFDKDEDFLDLNTDSFINNDSKLVIIKAGGGYDYLSFVIPKDEYSTYLEYRGSGALVGDELIELDEDYYINSSLSEFKDLFDSNNLRIINRVGTPDHSRGHDSASRKITSLNNVYDFEDNGIIGNFIANEDYAKTIVLGGYKPFIFRGGNYLNIGSNAYYNFYDYAWSDYKTKRLESIKDILSTREYPGSIGKVFENSVVINNVAVDSKNAGGRAGAGYNMIDNFTFLESIFDSNISNIARMGADGGYDTHRNQKAGLNNNLNKVSERTADYFNRVKDKQDVTIVIFSEFGRTNKLNSSEGTDHGKGGGMFIVSNNQNVLNGLDKKIYGNNSFEKSKGNWLGVGVDYRAVYSSLMKMIYGKDISEEVKGDFEIDKYIDETGPEVGLFRREFENYNSSRSRIRLKFKVKDTNFIPSQASYVKLEYGTDKDNMYEESSYRISRYMKISEDNINLYLNNIAPDTKYFYKVTLLDNQYNETILEGSFNSPVIKNNSDEISISGDTRLSRYNNLNFDKKHKFKNNTSSGLLLGSSTGSLDIQGENNISLLTNSGTYIEELTSSSSGSIWNGGFILPKEINKNLFLTDDSKFNNQKLSDYRLNKLIKVGADSLGVGMKLNKPVKLRFPSGNGNYGVIYSEDGISWTKLDNSKVKKNGSNLEIEVDHFTYFAIVEIDSNGDLIVDLEDDNSGDNGGSFENSNKSSSKGGTRLTKDKCEFGDYSPSYYDKTCGEDPDSEISMQGLETTDSYRLEQALEEVRQKEEEKAEIFDEVFNQSTDFEMKKDVLKLLRQDLSYSTLGDYKLVHIKGSKYNASFKKLGQHILNKNLIKSDEEKLIKYLNDLIIYISIYKIKNLDSEYKLAVREKIIEVAKLFSKTYKIALRKKKLAGKKEYVEPVNNNPPLTPPSNQGGEVDNKVEIISEQKPEPLPLEKEETVKSEASKEEVVLGEYEYIVIGDKVELKPNIYEAGIYGILRKNDIVREVTSVNSKGFLKVEVVKAKEINPGTQGYLYKKDISK